MGNEKMKPARNVPMRHRLTEHLSLIQMLNQPLNTCKSWTSSNHLKKKKKEATELAMEIISVIWPNIPYTDVSVYTGTETWMSNITKALDSHLLFFMSASIFISKLSLCGYLKLCRMISKLKQAQQYPHWFCQRQALFWLTWQSCIDACASG